MPKVMFTEVLVGSLNDIELTPLEITGETKLLPGRGGNVVAYSFLDLDAIAKGKKLTEDILDAILFNVLLLAILVLSRSNIICPLLSTNWHSSNILL